MESFKTIACVVLFILVLWLLLLLYLKHMQCEYVIKRAQDLADDLDSATHEFEQKEKSLIKNAKHWKLKATAPIMPDPNPPIIIHKSDLQKVKVRMEIGRFKSKEQAIREGINMMGDILKELVSSEFIEEYGKTVLYQEIWVGSSENFKK